MGKAAERLSKMIQFETVSARGVDRGERFKAFFSMLSTLYPIVFAQAERIPIENALLLKWHGETSKHPLVLMGHSDVVEAGEGWSVPPFSGIIKEDSIYGRGTADNKGSLCAILEAVSILMNKKFIPSTDIYILSTTDEEIITGSGSVNAVRYFRESGITPGLVLDEGGVINDYFFRGLERPVAFVGIAEKSYIDISLVAKGAGGHSSVPGNDASIIRLAKTVCSLQKRTFRKRLTPMFISMLKVLAKDMPKKEYLLFSHPKLLHIPLMRYLNKTNAHIRAMLQTTCAFTMMSGSAAPNILPKEASITANLRLLPGDPLDKIIRHWKKCAKKYGVEVRLLTAGETSTAQEMAPEGFKIISRAINMTNPGYGVATYVLVGATDSRHFSSICENVIKFSPFYLTKEQDDALHGKDENLSEESLLEGIQFYKNLIRQFSCIQL